LALPLKEVVYPVFIPSVMLKVLYVYKAVAVEALPMKEVA